MINEKSRAPRIVKELIGYFLEHKYYHFDLSFDLNPKELRVIIKVPMTSVPDHFFDLVDDLNLPRSVEIDEYYNALLGGHGTDHDYTLLGESVDEASLDFEDGILTLTVSRYNNTVK